MSSDADYDPFKFDLDVNVPFAVSGLQEANQVFASDVNDMLVDSGYNTLRSTMDNQAPDRNNELFQQYVNMTEPGVPAPGVRMPALGQPGFPGQNMSITAAMQIQQQSDPGNAVSSHGRSRSLNVSVEFPDIVPPSTEAMMEGASEEVVAAELDRLLGDWVAGIEAVGKAFAALSEDQEQEQEDVELGWVSDDGNDATQEGEDGE
jgi:hypothetical protein